MSHDTNTATVFTSLQFASIIAEMVKSQGDASASIAKAIVAVAYAANVGFPDAKGVVTPTAEAASTMFAALRKGVKKDLVAGILQQHCNLAYVSGAWLTYPLANKGWTEDEVKDIKAAAAAWEDFSPKAKPKGAFDVIAALQAVIEAHAKAVKANRAVVDGGAVPYISAIIGKYTGDKAIAEMIASGKVIAAPKEPANV